MNGQKIIKVDMDLNVTIHDFPAGSIREQNHKLCDLLWNGCDTIEHVMPKRLYTELKHTTVIKTHDSKCVGMLVDEEFLFKNGLKLNQIGSYLYETDKHGNPILGNILFVGEVHGEDGVEFSGIEKETFDKLHVQLKNMVSAMKATKEAMGI